MISARLQNLEDQTTQNSSTSLSLSMEAQSKSTKFRNWVWKMEQNNKRIGLGLGLLALQEFSQGFSLFLPIHKLSTIMQNMRLFLPMCSTSMSWFDPPNFKNEQQWDRQLSDAAVYETMHELGAKGLRTCLKNYCLVDPAAKMVPAVPANKMQPWKSISLERNIKLVIRIQIIGLTLSLSPSTRKIL